MAATGPPAPPIPRSIPASTRRAWLAALAFLVLVLGLPAPMASAHAQLIGSTPADGSVVEKAPGSVELEFNEDINPAFAQVIVRDQSGTSLASDAPKVAGPKVTTALPALGPGQVTVLFRVTSQDAHPISGKVSFTIEGKPGFAPPAATASPGAANPGAGGDRQALGETSAAQGASAAPAAWLYVVTGLAALALIGLGAIVLRPERRGAPTEVAPGPRVT